VKEFVALYRTLTRTIDTRARRAGFIALAAVGIVVAVLVAGTDPFDPVRASMSLINTFNLTFLVPVAALVFGTAALGDPTDDGTLVYLWLRPVPRRTITVAGALAAMTFVVPLAVVPAAIETAIFGVDGSVVFAAAAGAALAGVAYSAFFLLLGAVTNRSLVWGIGYVLIFESFLARGGKSLGALSIHSHAASVVSALSDRKLRLAYFSLPGALIGAAIITVVSLWIAALRLEHAEVP
jgi:ABC-2 type transport system permease protein